MAAPLAPWILRWIALKAGSKAVARYGAQTHARRMGRKAAQQSATTYRYGRATRVTPLGPSLQGPYVKPPSGSRRGRSSSSYQQSGYPPWAQGKRVTKSAPARRRSRRRTFSGAPRSGKGRMAPYCYIHKVRHWCWNTRKNNNK